MAGDKQQFETRAVQSGLRKRLDAQPSTPPIYPSTTFVYEDVREVHDALGQFGSGFAYSRNANPTVRALEEVIASLEETEDGVVFASGMAALHASVVAAGGKPGSTILAARDLYGVTRTLLYGFFAGLGVKTEFVDMADPEAVTRAVRELRPAMLVLEPISNPLLTRA